MASVQVRVPATTGNLGSGYDCVGMALALYNTITMTETDSGLEVIVIGEGADSLPRDEKNLCLAAARSVFETGNRQSVNLVINMEHDIPISRGLGSSGAAIVAGAVAANELMKHPLNIDDLLRLCTEIEGHPDNIVPSLLGGLTISGKREETIIYKRIHTSDRIKAIVAIPDFHLDTEKARGVLPKEISVEDAGYNLCNVGLLVGSFLTEDYHLLKHGMSDCVHQPYRQHLIPGFEEIIGGALTAGAHGAALSGAGPTVIALATENHEIIGEAMIEGFTRHSISAKYKILPIDNSGCQVVTT